MSRIARLARLVLLASGLSACSTTPVIPPISGTLWQLDRDTLDPHGDWQRIGATTLLVQWLAVDGTAFAPGSALPTAAVLPPWQRIAGEPWAREVILGLAGHFDERRARSDLAGLVAASAQLARLPTPLNVVGWYFPVEIDPTWSEAPTLAPLLAELPRPLWISVYDSANLGPQALVASLAGWLPDDVGVFFQDGVGVHAREAHVARRYVDALAAQFGHARVRLIAEAFRPRPGGGWRPATIDELAAQLGQYHGHAIYLFDGPHYLDRTLVAKIAARQRPVAVDDR